MSIKIKLTDKRYKITNGEIENVEGCGQLFYCPGCKIVHGINTWVGVPKNNFNGDTEKPTFENFHSSQYFYTSYGTANSMPPILCKSKITVGLIEYMSDSTHELAGKTVELPEWNEEYVEHKR